MDYKYLRPYRDRTDEFNKFRVSKLDTTCAYRTKSNSVYEQLTIDFRNMLQINANELKLYFNHIEQLLALYFNHIEQLLALYGKVEFGVDYKLLHSDIENGRKSIINLSFKSIDLIGTFSIPKTYFPLCDSISKYYEDGFKQMYHYGRFEILKRLEICHKLHTEDI